MAACMNDSRNEQHPIEQDSEENRINIEVTTRERDSVTLDARERDAQNLLKNSLAHMRLSDSSSMICTAVESSRHHKCTYLQNAENANAPSGVSSRLTSLGTTTR